MFGRKGSTSIIQSVRRWQRLAIVVPFAAPAGLLVAASVKRVPRVDAPHSFEEVVLLLECLFSVRICSISFRPTKGLGGRSVGHNNMRPIIVYFCVGPKSVPETFLGDPFVELGQ